jgi:4-hydroxybenzoate polyprenyltransferase
VRAHPRKQEAIPDGVADVIAGHRPARPPLHALVVSLRPLQWIKNGALLVAPLFAQQVTHLARLWPALAGIVAFSALASAVYLANDLVDREQDRLHPEKRRRPLAAGELSPALASATSVALALGGLALSAAIGRTFLAVALAYVALQVLYSSVLKHLVIVDVFAVAAGFVLRVVAGAEAVAVPISNWLYLCTLLLSLFLALAKRRAELTLLGDDAPGHRRILVEYSTSMVDQLVTVLSACTVLAYALYTMAPETTQKFGTDRLKFSVPFVLFGLFRYIYLVHRQGAGGQPERVILTDRPMQVNLAAYLAAVAWAIYS